MILRLVRLTFYFLSLVLTYLQLVATIAFSFTNETDRQALLAIKDQVESDPFQVVSSWNDSLHFCDWQGVTCGNKHQRVTVINMSTLGLAGPLSPHIGNLSFLEDINLQDNQFRGEIPKEIGRLFRLQFLRLANNSFHGEIPVNMTRCSELQVIDLSGNNLEGQVPAELSTLSNNLYVLRLARNNFSGKISPFFGNLSSLRILGLTRNNFHGNIPTELGWLSKLQVIALSSNKLSGTIPPHLFNISSIQTLSITNNLLSGEFPSNVGLTLPNLQSFSVSINQFTGSIPASLANASGLIQISLGDNNFSGPIPLNLGSLQHLQVLHFGHNPLGNNKANNIGFISTLTNCTNLITLSLSQTQLAGVLPTSIGNFSNTLRSVWLNTNYISGNIPNEIGNLVDLRYLAVDTNLLTGSIPDSIGKLTNLQELHLFINNLSGKIPSSIGNITGLGILVLMTNLLEGSIPVSLGNCTNLQGLHLATNRLTGVIPEEVISLSSFTIGFNLAENYLIGSLPSQVGNLKNLATMDISQNKLTGEIPSSLGDCVMLETLRMDGNSFVGNLPSSLRLLKNIQFMDLSRNNLSGPIPRSLGELPLLGYLNLSFNMFDGEVPNGGVFSNISEFSVMGNKMLCGGITQLELPECPKEVFRKQRKISTRAVIILATVIPLFIVLVLISVYVTYRLCRPRRPLATASLVETQYPKLSYHELLQSTNGFSSENLIGSGRFGSVYKGILGSSEQIVAVKVLNLHEHGADKSFLAECEALRNLRHRNLVKIVTACLSLDSKGNDFKALVFELMPNGSLEDWLHHDSKSLNLLQRLNIAIDVASALDYLHHHCEIPVTHCDVKPSNILLDDDLCAHVGDFGLARFLLATRDKSSHAQSSSIGVRGTIGYVAPEYGMGGEIWTLGDVYSYGILLLEMFTGKRPTDSMFGDIGLHNYAKMALPHRVMEIVDQQLLLEEEDLSDDTCQSSKDIVGTEECLTSIIKIGVSCSAEVPSERMDINHAIMELHSVRDVYSSG